jgi:hypothetical protein
MRDGRSNWERRIGGQEGRPSPSLGERPRPFGWLAEAIFLRWQLDFGMSGWEWVGWDDGCWGTFSLSRLPFLAFYYAHALAANTTKLLATNSSESLDMKHVTFCVRRLLSPVCR